MNEQINILYTKSIFKIVVFHRVFLKKKVDDVIQKYRDSKTVY